MFTKKAAIAASVIALGGVSATVALASSESDSERPGAGQVALNSTAGGYLRDLTDRKGQVVKQAKEIQTAVGSVVIADVAPDPLSQAKESVPGTVGSGTCLAVSLRGGGGSVACRPEDRADKPLTSVNQIGAGIYSVVAALPSGSTGARVESRDGTQVKELSNEDSVVSSELSKAQVGTLRYTDGKGAAQSLDLASATAGD